MMVRGTWRSARVEGNRVSAAVYAETGCAESSVRARAQMQLSPVPVGTQVRLAVSSTASTFKPASRPIRRTL